MPRIILGIVFASLLPLASADTAMTLARQPAAPLQLIKTTHSLRDALEGATVKNLGDKSISGYRVGWAIVKNGKVTFQKGPWINLPAGVAPGALQSVPAQGVRLDEQAQEMLFFVAEIRYTDGSRWKADQQKLVFSRAA
jgi:hypothetical protein